ncbi:hypothetical protein VNO77_30820 [Canavalia gladiata]|uniref:Uncharacterized protein n=1 Tax=Canavalia gladiata TaxID=3824 RepID=A0AAN9Q4E7_CANGL
MDYANYPIKFAYNKSSHYISLKAIALLQICEDHLAEDLVPEGATAALPSYGPTSGDGESQGDDPPRLWVQNRMVPGDAYTRNAGDKLAETISFIVVPEVSTI